jgi:ribosomal protein S25
MIYFSINLRSQPFMFSDPQTITVNAVAKVMPRVTNNGLVSTYQLADQTFKLTISHEPKKGRIRSMVRIDQRAVVADPLTSVNDYETLGVYVVVDRPEVGFSMAQQDQLLAALDAWLNTAASDKLFGMES